MRATVHVAGEPVIHGQYCVRCGCTLVDAIPALEGRMFSVSADGGARPVYPRSFPPRSHVEINAAGTGRWITADPPSCIPRFPPKEET